MSPPEQIVDLFAIKESEYVLTAWMDEILIDVVHDVIDYQIADSQLFVVPEILDMTIDIIENLKIEFLMLGFVFEGELEHQTASLYSIDNF